MDPNKNACVTGGSGYIAPHLIRALLCKGYNVRATVRDPEDTRKNAFLWDIPGARERLQLLKADLLDEGSFDAAIAGSGGVFHTAAPVFVRDCSDPEKSYLMPCVNGTLNVLKSCAKTSTVKRVVLTSSCASVRFDYNRVENDPPLDESCWSNPDYCKQYQLWYAWAKTLAEQAAWTFCREHKLDLVVVNPSFVVGPMLSPLPSSGIEFVLGLLTGHLKTYPNSRLGFVHIDDVVTAHLIAYENQSVSGRLICSGDVYHWREITEILKRLYPTYPITSICGQEKGSDILHSISTSKIRALGLKEFKGIDEMFTDCVNCLREASIL